MGVESNFSVPLRPSPKLNNNSHLNVLDLQNLNSNSLNVWYINEAEICACTMYANTGVCCVTMDAGGQGVAAPGGRDNTDDRKQAMAEHCKAYKELRISAGTSY